MIPAKLFDVSNLPQDAEQVEIVFEKVGVKLERIVSFGHPTPDGFWYDQKQVEWVVLLKGTATLLYKSGEKLDMCAGDYVMIPAYVEHRVESVSQDAIWLALLVS